MDADGNLYGTTTEGGRADQGTVFKISPGGTETVLYSFSGGADGAAPVSTLIFDQEGNLYGTTSAGGKKAKICKFRDAQRFDRHARRAPARQAGGCGVVFKLAPDGTETVLYAFDGVGDGAIPLQGMITDAQGNLYGTTFEGGSVGPGCKHGCGTVYQLSPSGQLSVLHTFCGEKGCLDGKYPYDRLAADKKFQTLYGTAAYGGDSGKGVVFSVNLGARH